MPPIAVLAATFAIFTASCWMMFCHRQKMGSDPKDTSKDPVYRPVLGVVIFSLMALTMFVSLGRRVLIAFDAWVPGDGILRLADWLALPASDASLVAGSALFVAGFALRIWAIRILGRFFTFEIGIRTGHEIVEVGPYRLIRHPSYTGFLMMLAGAGIAAASLLAVLTMAGGTLGFFFLRMNHEESMLVKHFGEKYREYMRRTKRLIPYVY